MLRLQIANSKSQCLFAFERIPDKSHFRKRNFPRLFLGGGAISNRSISAFSKLEARKPTLNLEIQQNNTAFTRSFSKSSRELCLLRCDTSQEPNGNCSEKKKKTFSDELFVLFWVVSWGLGFPLREIAVRDAKLETFRRSYREPPQPDLPLWHRPTRTPPPGPDSDLISTRFRPDLDLQRVISGPNQVEIGSKSGTNQVRAEGFSWVGAGGVGPVGGGFPVAPPERFYAKRLTP